MAQGFYTLEEAAERLGMAAHELNLMVQRREVRGFQDRGTWRFRTQDIEELARRRGRASDPDLQLRDSKAPSPPPPPAGDIFPFELDKGNEQDFGTDIFSVAAEPARTPPGSDSDVRLVPDGSKLDLQTVEPRAEGKPSSSAKIKPDSDSDVKLVDVSSDDVVPIGSEDRPQSDSDVRLDAGGSSKPGHDSGVKLGGKPGAALSDETLLIGEINLEDAPSKSGRRKTPRTSALDRTEPADAKSRDSSPLTDSSDLDLTPAAEKQPGSSLFDSSSEELTLDSSGELNVAGGKGKPAASKPDSPVDSDISLGESGSDEISFELSVDDSEAGPTTPKPGAVKKLDSSSEFELTLDDEGLAPLEGEQSDTELLQTNLTLEPERKKPAAKKKKGDSELELQIDDAATDLESSEFELAIEDQTATEGEEVIIDEDIGEADETAVRPMLDDEGVEELLAEGEEGLVIDEAAEEEDREAATQAALASIAAASASPPSWGAWSLVHLPTTFLMVVVGFLLLEMMRSVLGYTQPNQPAGMVFEITRDIAKAIGLL
jgi:hypothetical protein